MEEWQCIERYRERVLCRRAELGKCRDVVPERKNEVLWRGKLVPGERFTVPRERYMVLCTEKQVLGPGKSVPCWRYVVPARRDTVSATKKQVLGSENRVPKGCTRARINAENGGGSEEKAGQGGAAI